MSAPFAQLREWIHSLYSQRDERDLFIANFIIELWNALFVTEQCTVLPCGNCGAIGILPGGEAVQILLGSSKIINYPNAVDAYTDISAAIL